MLLAIAELGASDDWATDEGASEEGATDADVVDDTSLDDTAALDGADDESELLLGLLGLGELLLPPQALSKSDARERQRIG